MNMIVFMALGFLGIVVMLFVLTGIDKWLQRDRCAACRGASLVMLPSWPDSSVMANLCYRHYNRWRHIAVLEKKALD